MNINITACVDKIINSFKEEFLNEDQIISRDYPPSKRLIFDNFDDIAPFLSYFNQTTFLQSQIDKIRQENFDYLFFENIIYSYKIDEFLGGLYTVYKQNNNEETLSIINNFLIFLNEKFFFDNCFYGAYDRVADKTIKIEYPWSSGLLETFIEMKEFDPTLVNKSKKIINKWIESDFFIKNNLFPYNFSNQNIIQKYSLIKQKEVPYSREKDLKYLIKNFLNTNLFSANYSRIMKQNSTLIFTIIELYKLDPNQKYKLVIDSWIESVITKLTHNEIIYGEWHPYRKHLTDDNITHTFIFIDIVCDYLHFIERKQKLIYQIQLIINKRLSSMTPEGLLPISFKNTLCHIDSSMDFAISIRRFGEIINNTKYLNLSNQIILSILEYHKYEFGFATLYESRSGIVRIPKNTIDPKYNGLLLKGIISLENQDKKIQSTPYLHDLFKDR